VYVIVFLSWNVFIAVGYSTCHWCHVMERESFENEEIGCLLNDSFVSIKVDREERPDVDRVYMSFIHVCGVKHGSFLCILLYCSRIEYQQMFR